MGGMLKDKVYNKNPRNEDDKKGNTQNLSSSISAKKNCNVLRKCLLEECI
jgi:hypothetical protein